MGHIIYCPYCGQKLIKKTSTEDIWKVKCSYCFSLLEIRKVSRRLVAIEIHKKQIK